jgi:alkanesulfonate monooxygenase SsuD/methylene tetrahydromethanopterin reductase-like flavin-dependent oxidoreductase (luciferase family)
MENHGVEYNARFRVMSDKIKAMKVLWVEEEAEYHGEFVDFDPVWSSPKPLQKPHPPIILGGETDHTLRRVVDYADGWLPRWSDGFEPAREMARLKAAAAKAGRPASQLSVTVFRAPTEAAALAKYAAAGIDRVLFDVPDQPREKVLPLLDQYAKLIA